jgi:hypothetical protein
MCEGEEIGANTSLHPDENDAVDVCCLFDTTTRHSKKALHHAFRIHKGNVGST